MPEIEQFIKTDSDLSTFLSINEYPYTVCKVVFFNKKNNTMEDFKAKPVNYIKKQVSGFRIFLIHAGFVSKPADHIPDEIIEKQVDLMVQWYLDNKTVNKEGRTIKRFLITNK